MRIRREKDGTIVIRFTGDEARLYRELVAELRSHVEKPDFTKRIAQRLFPRYADDDKVNEEVRQLLYDEQRKQKMERVEAFAAAMGNVPVKGGELRLTPAEAELLLALLTDLRLMYAAVIGIEDDSWGEDINPLFPPSREVAVYLHLTNIQQALLDHAFGVHYERRWRKPK